MIDLILFLNGRYKMTRKAPKNEYEKYVFKYNNCHTFVTNHGFTYVRAMIEKFIESGAIEGSRGNLSGEICQINFSFHKT